MMKQLMYPLNSFLVYTQYYNIKSEYILDYPSFCLDAYRHNNNINIYGTFYRHTTSNAYAFSLVLLLECHI
jgi:hypothetical protein